MKRIAGVCNRGKSASKKTGTNGLELKMAVTSAIKVYRTIQESDGKSLSGLA